jgi:hypothetical protein
MVADVGGGMTVTPRFVDTSAAEGPTAGVAHGRVADVQGDASAPAGSDDPLDDAALLRLCLRASVDIAQHALTQCLDQLLETRDHAGQDALIARVRVLRQHLQRLGQAGGALSRLAAYQPTGAPAPPAAPSALEVAGPSPATAAAASTTRSATQPAAVPRFMQPTKSSVALLAHMADEGRHHHGARPLASSRLPSPAALPPSSLPGHPTSIDTASPLAGAAEAWSSGLRSASLSPPASASHPVIVSRIPVRHVAVPRPAPVSVDDSRHIAGATASHTSRAINVPTDAESGQWPTVPNEQPGERRWTGGRVRFGGTEGGGGGGGGGAEETRGGAAVSLIRRSAGRLLASQFALTVGRFPHGLALPCRACLQCIRPRHSRLWATLNSHRRSCIRHVVPVTAMACRCDALRPLRLRSPVTLTPLCILHLVPYLAPARPSRSPVSLPPLHIAVTVSTSSPASRSLACLFTATRPMPPPPPAARLLALPCPAEDGGQHVGPAARFALRCAFSD